MTSSDQEIKSALERLPENIKLLTGAVDGLELVIRNAEQLSTPAAKQALPYLSLIWLYSSGMLAILNATRNDGKTLWNAPALAVLCRALQEAFLCLFYFAIEKTDQSEKEFRAQLLARHETHKRWDLLRRSDTKNPEIKKELDKAEIAKRSIEDTLKLNPHLKTIPSDTAQSILKTSDKYFAEPSQDIWERAGMPKEYYDVIFRYLSQYAHATPYAAAALVFHQAEHEEGAVNMNVPVGLALSCVVMSIKHMGELHEALGNLIPEAFKNFTQQNCA